MINHEITTDPLHKNNVCLDFSSDCIFYIDYMHIFFSFTTYLITSTRCSNERAFLAGLEHAIASVVNDLLTTM